MIESFYVDFQRGTVVVLEHMYIFGWAYEEELRNGSAYWIFSPMLLKRFLNLLNQ